jgi:hypothetical protein
MSNLITSCHKVEAKIYSGGEGTSHYYCPVCDQSVNADGSNPMNPKDEAQDSREILKTLVTKAVMLMPDESYMTLIDEADAAINRYCEDKVREAEKKGFNIGYQAAGGQIIPLEYTELQERKED